MITMERQLRELTEFDGHGANVLSLYLPTDPLCRSRDELDLMLGRLAESLREGVGEYGVAALQEEISAARDYVNSMIAPPAGIAIFTCTPRHFFRVLRLPAEVGPAAWWAPWAHVATLLDVPELATL